MKTQNCIDTITPPTAPIGFRPPSWAVVLLRHVQGWAERSRQRRQLAWLSDHALKDIGLTREQVRIELEKTFWQP